MSCPCVQWLLYFFRILHRIQCALCTGLTPAPHTRIHNSVLGTSTSLSQALIIEWWKRLWSFVNVYTPGSLEQTNKWKRNVSCSLCRFAWCQCFLYGPLQARSTAHGMQSGREMRSSAALISSVTLTPTPCRFKPSKQCGHNKIEPSDFSTPCVSIVCPTYFSLIYLVLSFHNSIFCNGCASLSAYDILESLQSLLVRWDKSTTATLTSAFLVGKIEHGT